MDLTTIIGGILSILATWIIFILNGIKKASDATNVEIKEMNKDIRDVLVSLSKSDERIESVSKRIELVHDLVKILDHRVLIMEQHE